MKKIITLCLVLLLGVHLAYAQKIKTLQDSLVLSQKEGFALIKKLYQAKILSKAGKTHFEDMITSEKSEDLLTEYQSVYQDEPLGSVRYALFSSSADSIKQNIFLSTIVAKMYFMEELADFITSVQKNPSLLFDEKKKIFNKKIMSWIGDSMKQFLKEKPKNKLAFDQKLKEIGLLPLRIKLPLENEYFKHIYWQLFDFQNYEKIKQRQLSTIKQLFENGILSQKNYDKLITSHKPYQLYSKVDVLSFAEHTSTINLYDLPRDSQKALEKLFELVRDNILPELEFTFEGEYKELVEPKNRYTFASEETFTKIRIGKHIYHKRKDFQLYVLYAKYRIRESILDTDGIDGTELEVINDFLADIEHPKRLYMIRDDYNSKEPQKMYACFILLDRKVLGNMPEVGGIFGEIHFFEKYRLSYNDTHKFLTELMEIGLLPNTNKTQIEEMATKFVRDNIKNHFWLMLSLPKMVALADCSDTYYSLDSDTTEQKTLRFQCMLQDFAQASRGTFSPTHITESKVGDVFNVSFVCKGKTYTKTINESRMDEEVYAWVKSVLQEIKAEGTFYRLAPNYHQKGEVPIYLTARQYKFLSSYIKIDE